MRVSISSKATIFGFRFDNADTFIKALGFDKCYFDVLECFENGFWSYFSEIYANKYPSLKEHPVDCYFGLTYTTESVYDIPFESYQVLLGINFGCGQFRCDYDHIYIDAKLPSDIEDFCKDFIAFNMKYALVYFEKGRIEMAMVPEEEVEQLVEKSNLRVPEGVVISGIFSVSA